MLVRHKRKHKSTADELERETTDGEEESEVKRVRPVGESDEPERPPKRQRTDLLDQLWGSTSLTKNILTEHEEESENISNISLEERNDTLVVEAQ